MIDLLARKALAWAVVLFAVSDRAFASDEIDYGQVEIAIAGVGEVTADLDYGEYLAGECVSCHAVDGPKQAQIPAIAGRNREALIRAMVEYRTGFRKNKVMQTVMTTKGNEEIAALAAWYAAIER
ncbi:c-type cytochrome [Notoacmeibacter marinus]|uniref:c-type cytochrome n=1 Tax=Notoacmeibacter marinus TaxID=1876515 RepID=UPI000DF4ADC5|nr:c-type cytochrome [Notoacmeibacter marinus]